MEPIEEVPTRYSGIKWLILSCVLRPSLRRTDLILTAPERLVPPQTTRRTRITARRHRPWNITQETRPDAPIKTRWIHTYSGFPERLHCACADGLLRCSAPCKRTLLFVTSNSTFTMQLSINAWSITLSATAFNSGVWSALGLSGRTEL